MSDFEDFYRSQVERCYDETVDILRCSVFTGGVEVHETTTLAELLESDVPLLVEFAKDNDIQYMRICSTNIGMIRTYQKRLVAKEKPPLGMAKKTTPPAPPSSPKSAPYPS